MVFFYSVLIFSVFFLKVDAPGSDKKRDLTDFQKGRIYALRFDAEWTFQAIADKLALSINTVKEYCRRAKEDPDHGIGCRANCGRKRKTSHQTDRQIKRISVADPFKDANAIKHELPEAELICKRTVQNRLLEAGLGGRKAAHKPLLNLAHMATRLNWAKEKNEWKIENNWNHVIFSDESTFDISSTGPVWVRRPVGQRFNPRYIKKVRNRAIAHVNVWGAFSSHDYIKIYRINGNLNSKGYTDILQAQLLPNLNKLLPQAGFFQQDNAPIHMSKHTKAFLQENYLQIMDWPALSPDMNPIENVWAEISKKLDREKINNSDQLFAKISEIWENLMKNEEYRMSLIDSMPNRVKSLIESKGGSTKY